MIQINNFARYARTEIRVQSTYAIDTYPIGNYSFQAVIDMCGEKINGKKLISHNKSQCELHSREYYTRQRRFYLTAYNAPEVVNPCDTCVQDGTYPNSNGTWKFPPFDFTARKTNSNKCRGWTDTVRVARNYSYNDFPTRGTRTINNGIMSVVCVYDDNYYKQFRFAYSDITLRRTATTANDRRWRKIFLSIGPLCSLSVRISARVSSFVRKIIYETARKCTLSFRYSRKAFADSATIRTPQDLSSR